METAHRTESPRSTAPAAGVRALAAPADDRPDLPEDLSTRRRLPGASSGTGKDGSSNATLGTMLRRRKRRKHVRTGTHDLFALLAGQLHQRAHVGRDRQVEREGA